jgi:hypothetical protein
LPYARLRGHDSYKKEDSMPSWPLALPVSPLVEGFRETPPDTVLRSTMDQGPAKLRRRTTAGAGTLTLTYMLSRSQVDTLLDFFNDSLAGGTLAFDFTHPVNGAPLSCRFRQSPAYAPINAEYFKAALELEVLP